MTDMTDPAAPMRVLVVDDDALIRALIAASLDKLGVSDIQHAANGRDALELIRVSEPPVDLVLLDLFMPKMDGIEVVRHLGGGARQPALAFITGVNAALLGTAVHIASVRGLRILGAIEKPISPEALTAIVAMYRKGVQTGRDKVGMVVSTAELREALQAGHLELHYQPKVNLKTNAVEGFESLVRWRHPELGLIPPGIFIPIAEESGLINALTNKMFIAALEQYAHWAAEGLTTKISVNLSARMLVELSLPDRIAGEMEKHNVDPKHIILEVTESGVFQDEADSLDILARLTMKGFPLAIDDFGTGYSSMAQLRRIPFAELKIDRAFVSGAAGNAKTRTILDSSVALGKKLGLTVVAEGVETADEWKLLADVGTDVVQGYFVSRPMPAKDIRDWLKGWNEIRR